MSSEEKINSTTKKLINDANRMMTNLSDRNSDIFEHLPTLYEYAKECESIIELGVRGCVSTYPLTKGLLENNSEKKRLVSVDLIKSSTVTEFENLIKEVKDVIDFNFYTGSDLNYDIKENFDLVFIDTWHVRGQLQRELDKFAPHCNKYIIMHDTTVDEFVGESIRCGWDIERQSRETGFTIKEIQEGLWPAVMDFLEKNKGIWQLHKRYINNNGLTILKKKLNIVFPISFAIPETCIIPEINYQKQHAFSFIIPDGKRNYTYEKESDYYQHYRDCYYAITSFKGGWDCLRHYEQLAAGCIPYFINLDKCPPNTLHNFPKELIKEAMNLPGVSENTIDFGKFPKDRYYEILKKLMLYTKEHLTTKSLAQYVLEKAHIKQSDKILFLSGDSSPDYQRCLLLNGLKNLMDTKVQDHPKIKHLYNDFPEESCQKLYGRGFSYTRKLDSKLSNEEKFNIEDLINKQYNYIIYGSIRNMPYYDIISKIYSPDKIIIVNGEDKIQDSEQYSQNNTVNSYSQHILFIRELD
jgi:hypothetical protein